MIEAERGEGQLIKGSRGAVTETDRKADRVPSINAAESRQWSGFKIGGYARDCQTVDYC